MGHAGADTGEVHSWERQATAESSTVQLKRHVCWNPTLPGRLAAAAAAVEAAAGAAAGEAEPAGNEADSREKEVDGHVAAEADEGCRGHLSLLKDCYS